MSNDSERPQPRPLNLERLPLVSILYSVCFIVYFIFMSFMRHCCFSLITTELSLYVINFSFFFFLLIYFC